MSINAYNANKINMVKAAMTKQAQKTATAAKPEYMKMTGSIFDAPGVKNKTTNEIADLNTTRSLNELNKNNQTAEVSNSSETSSTESIANIDNAADGRAAAADAEANADNVRSLTSETEQDANTVNKFSSDAVKLDEKISKDNKKYEKQLQKQEKELKENNVQLQKLVKESEEAQQEIEDAQNELESLMGSNSFSINGDDGTNPNSDRIKELQSIIGTKTQVVQANGRVIYTLQRSSSRTLKQMGQTNKAYIRTQNINQKSIEENQSTTDKVIKTATTIEQVSALTSQVGQMVGYAGKGLVLLGKSLSGVPWVGAAVAAALISTGTVMQKVGNVVELVGNYGQAAANITKTAAYAADGNLAGALQSAAAAAQTGIAAGKSTADLQKNFASIDQAAQQATKEAAANRAAIDIVEENKDNLKGMTEKEARKAVSTDLKNQMAKGEITFDEGLSTKDKITNFAENAKNKQGQRGLVIADNSLNNATEKFAETVTDKGFTIEGNKILDKTGKEISRRDRNKIGNKFTSSFKNVASNSVKSSESFWDKALKVGTSLQSSAAMFLPYLMQQNAYNYSNYPSIQLDDRTLDIINRNQRRRAAIGAMYR